MHLCGQNCIISDGMDLTSVPETLVTRIKVSEGQPAHFYSNNQAEHTLARLHILTIASSK